MPPRLTALPPSSLEEVLFPIIQLDDGKFEALADAFSKEHSFALPKSALTLVNQKTGLQERQISFIANSLAFLYVTAQDHPAPHNEAVRDLVSSLDLSGLADTDQALLSKRISALIGRSSIHDAYRKTEQLRSGLLPSARNLRTIVDMRPDFGPSKSDPDPTHFVISIQAKISTDSSLDSNKELTFQMREDVLDEVIAELERARKKIGALRKFAKNNSIEIK